MVVAELQTLRIRLSLGHCKPLLALVRDASTIGRRRVSRALSGRRSPALHTQGLRAPRSVLGRGSCGPLDRPWRNQR